MSEFLLEIYSEEIPANMQEKVLPLLLSIFTKEIFNLGIIGEIFAEISVCRIAFYSHNLIINSQENLIPIRGPIITASIDAINGFLKKNNIENIDKLQITGGYYFYTPSQINKSVSDLLSKNITKIIDLLSSIWSRRMHWNSSKKEWIRPIRNILCLFENKIINFNYANLVSNNLTFGNKNITNKTLIEVNSIDDYFNKLKENFVIVKRKERVKIIESSLRNIEKEYNVNFKLDRNRDLINEVAGLSEYLIIKHETIPEQFSDLPSCIIEQKIKKDQKYFVSYNKHGIDKIIAISIECNPNKVENVLKGNMKVLNARLSDIKFFYQQDIKMFLKCRQINESSVKQLLSLVPINEKLGNLYDKSLRIKTVMQNLLTIGGKDILGGLDLDTIALHLKLDMITHAYKEFPDLQGYIGSEYATRIWGLSAEYSNVFAAQHGINVGYGEHIPAIANALEYVASHLYIGSEFTSSRDPFAIERSINLVSSIYEWVPNLGLHIEAIKILLPKIFESVAFKLSEILIKSAKKINIKRLKQKFNDYLYIEEICNYYFNLHTTYFVAQINITKALDWVNISDEFNIVIDIYKRCKNLYNINPHEKNRLTIIEWGQINDILDLLDIAIEDIDENSIFAKIKWTAFSIDLERYFNHYKIADSIDRIIFIRNICTKIEIKYPFLPSIDF